MGLPSQDSSQGQEVRAPAHEAGSYEARPVDWGIIKSNAGKPQAAVSFCYKHADKEKYINYYGSFTGGARPYTMENLARLGLKGKVSDMVDGCNGKALDVDLKVQIVIRHETDEKTGKTRARVAFINSAGGGIADSRVNGDEAATLLGEIDAEYEQYKVSTGQTAEPSALEKMQAGNKETDVATPGGAW